MRRTPSTQGRPGAIEALRWIALVALVLVTGLLLVLARQHTKLDTTSRHLGLAVAASTPETPAPATSAPETPAPETSAPETPAPGASASGDPQASPSSEIATKPAGVVSVLNASGVGGMAASVATFLRDQGWRVGEVARYPGQAEKTVIHADEQNMAQALLLQEQLAMDAEIVGPPKGYPKGWMVVVLGATATDSVIFE